MNENNSSWKKTDEVEINLIDLLKKLCRQWKAVVVCAIVFAALIGGYKTMSNRRASNVTDQVKTAQASLTADEKQRVKAALELSDGIEGQEAYLSDSILMNVDSSKRDKATLLYSVENAAKKDKQKIVESYLNYILSDDIVEQIQSSDKKTWNMDASYLAELIFAWQKTESTNQIVISEVEENAMIVVELTGKDADMAKKLADAVQGIIQKYQPIVQKVAGKHKLTLLSAVQSVKSDNDLATRQNDKRSQLSTALYNLKTITDSFTEQQKLAYNDKLAESGRQVQEQTNVSGGISIKWIAVGFIGGIAVYCCLFACWYLLRDTVKSLDEVKEHYTFPVFGGITLKKGSKGNGEGLSGKEKDTYERERAQLLNRIRLACKTQKIDKICLATDFSFSEQDKNFLTIAQKQLKEWGLNVILGENAAGNVAVWDEMTEVGVVLVVCKIDTTTHKAIDEEMSFYQENNLQVLGAAVIEC